MSAPFKKLLISRARFPPRGDETSLHDTLESIFKGRGYSVLTSSQDNRYIFLRKGSSKMSVGYSVPGHKVTEGEADMFVSMAMNDSADSMLFISPSKVPGKVKKLLDREGAAVWDRTALVISIGEHVLEEEEKASGSTRLGSGSIMDLFQEDDFDPVSELRSYHRLVEEQETAGFKVYNISFGNTEEEEELDIWEDIPAPAAPKPRMEKAPEKVEERPDPDEKVQEEMPLFDLPGIPVETPPEDAPPREEERKEKERKKEPNRVPDEILLDPWAGFEEWKEEVKSAAPEYKESPRKEKAEPAADPWLGSVMLPVKYSETDARSMAGSSEDEKLDMSYLPFLLIRADYELKSSETNEDLKQEGTFLFNSLGGTVTDLPPNLFEEIQTYPDKWDGRDPPKVLSDPKEDYNTAMASLRKSISVKNLARDRKVRETLMSTIYREIKYNFKKGSIRIISSKRLMMPFWIRRTKTGEPEWMMDAFLGRLSPKDETIIGP
ncbi:MAG: hypothetical protein ACMUIE_02765 [Thermoplasmatota archaeon]